MRNKPDLLVLAAGLGSRYGGLKQLDGVGPCGESIMEYSIFDAKKAGFEKIVFVIKKAIQKDFKSQILSKIEGFIDFDIVFQEIDSLPGGFNRSVERKKPWGTGHAILSAKDKIINPFAVINADDYYGPGAFDRMGDYLRAPDGDSTEFSLLGYRLENTLSLNGSVSRGICEIKDGFLTTLTERTRISRELEGVFYQGKTKNIPIDPKACVSMNFWGFTPLIFKLLEDRFLLFAKKHHQSLKEEFMITEPIDYAIQNKIARIKVLPVNERWMGITYPDDRKRVQQGIADLVSEGVYPENLFSVL